MFYKISLFISILISPIRNIHLRVADLEAPVRQPARQTGVFIGIGLLLLGFFAVFTGPFMASQKTNAAAPPPAYDGVLMLKRSVEELTTEANRIVVADVVSVQAEFDVDKSKIFTFVTLNVDKVLKGHSNAQTTLTLPGGEVNGVRLLVGGVPNFVAGERVLLFLVDDPEFPIAGMWQGKYSLSGDEAYQPETGQTVSVASLEKAISQALDNPVEIGASPQVVHAQFATGCPAWSASQVPVPHLVNPANAGTGAPTGNNFASAMYDALYAWQSLADSWVTLRVAGTTTLAADAIDGKNLIYWTGLSGDTLGINTCWFSGSTRLESDTRFDNSNRFWTMTAEAGKIDLRAVAEHELGHGIGIGHSDQFCDGTASTPLMCAFVSSGVRKTILADDSNAAAFLYPLSGPAPAAPSNLSVTDSGSFNTLSWTDNAGDEQAFEIQRADGSCSSTFKGAATVPANTTTYTDSDYGVGLSGVSCYRVKALNEGGDSGYSNASRTNPVAAGQALASTALITASANVTYTVSITNHDSNPVTNLTAGNTHSANASGVSGAATANPGIDLGNFPISPTPPFTITAGSTLLITYVLQVTDTAQRGDLLTSTVTISAPILFEATQASTSEFVNPYKSYLPIILKN